MHRIECVWYGSPPVDAFVFFGDTDTMKHKRGNKGFGLFHSPFSVITQEIATQRSIFLIRLMPSEQIKKQ
jgi:hypothetical protein